jgi:hypothetical protein
MLDASKVSESDFIHPRRFAKEEQVDFMILGYNAKAC